MRAPSRRSRLIGAVTLVLAAVFAVGVASAGLACRRDLSAGRSALEQARTALADGHAVTALQRFTEAERRFAAARRTVGGAWLGALARIPVLGRTADALAAVGEAGERIAAAGNVLAAAVRDLPGGLRALTPRGGRVPTAPFDDLAGAAAEARDQAAGALAALRAAPHGLLPGPVTSALERAERETAALHQELVAAAEILRGAPGFLGADGPRRYFFGAQNPAELRGTGGVIGAYAILTIDRGRFRFTPFRPIQSLPAPEPREVPPPSAEYATNYDAFRTGGRFWLASNLTPDFPTVARVVLDAYEALQGERLDGVILADPFALQALLRIVGPAYVPELDRMVGPANVVPFTTQEAYGLYEDQATRKRALGAVAQAAFERFLSRSEADPQDLQVLARTAAEGHILVYSRDPELQSGIARTGAGGALRTEGADLFAVIENSAGGTKVDPYEDREISYRVDLWPGGAAQLAASIRLTNHAPDSGLPRYVIGPHPGFAAAGEGVQLVTVYCGPGCRLQEARRDGSPIALWTGTELGLRYFRDYFGTPSGATSELDLRLYEPSAWSGGPTGGTYHLRFLNQTTVRPTHLDLEIHPPAGMRIVEAGPEVRLEEGVARWSGTPGRILEIWVRFEPPPLIRWWRALTT
jgi:hypothetical protein